MLSWAEFEDAALEFASTRHCLLVGADGVAIGFLATVSAYSLHAFLGNDDEEFGLSGSSTEVLDPLERSAVRHAMPFAAFKKDDPIFRLAIERAVWVYWERVGKPDTTAIRKRWPPRRGAA